LFQASDTPDAVVMSEGLARLLGKENMDFNDSGSGEEEQQSNNEETPQEDEDNEEDKQFALATTKHVFTELAKFMAPMTPFFAEDLYKKVGGDKESVHLESWPKSGKVDEKVLESMELVRALVTTGLEARQKANIKVRQPLAKLVIDKKLDAEFSELVRDELNVKEIIFADTFELDTNITDELRHEGDFREFLRSIQGMRKDADLSPTDLIRLFVPESSKVIIAGFEEELKKVAGIKEIKFEGVELRIEK
jgi:isoleucyl-tRNA synthetase